MGIGTNNPSVPLQVIGGDKQAVEVQDILAWTHRVGI